MTTCRSPRVPPQEKMLSISESNLNPTSRHNVFSSIKATIKVREHTYYYLLQHRVSHVKVLAASARLLLVPKLSWAYQHYTVFCSGENPKILLMCEHATLPHTHTPHHYQHKTD